MNRRQMARVILSVCFLMLACFAFGQNQPNLRSIVGLQPGSVLFLSLTGNSAGGSVWGTDTYTLDSSLTAAAVHAGVLANGQAGTVAIVISEGLSSYSGSYCNGVQSNSWGAFGLSYRFVGFGSTKTGSGIGSDTTTAPQTGPVSQPQPQPVPSTATLYAFNDWTALIRLKKPTPGTVVHVQVTASTAGTIWGTGIYTIDSALPAATIHAGLLANGQTGIIKVTIQPGQSSYTGSTQRGVVSQNYSSYPTSYSIEPVTQDYQNLVAMISDPGTVRNIAYVAAGKTYVVWVTGTAKESTIWGTDTYTADSQLSEAVVHAGILRTGETGPVIVHVVSGLTHYAGSSRNGITSAEYGEYSLAYTLEAAR
ncbi:MAG: hypothetical protein LLF89_09935 [Spirochaetaceae bacterium]|nr:hypothetical protein [Spirochaetaceae bacterium]